RLAVIWVSSLGALPFTLALPSLDLFWAAAMSAMVGLILSSAFSATLVCAPELVPGKVGLTAGFVVGLACGIAPLRAAARGPLGAWLVMIAVVQICAFLPALGILTVMLPKTAELHREMVPA